MADPTKILSLAALPDPAHPTSVMFIAALGSFLATGLARARRQAPDRVAEATAVGAFAGFGTGLAIYLVANTLGCI